MRKKEGLIASLREFGLTEYEARVYLALLSKGALKVSEVAKEAEVPRTKAYEAVRGLKEKGLLETFGKPMRCRPLNFESVMGKIVEAEEKRVRALKSALTKVRNFSMAKMTKIRTVEGKFQVVYPESVINKLQEMIESSRTYFHALVDGWGIKLLQRISPHILTLLLTEVDVKIILSYKDQDAIIEGGELPFSFKVGPIIDGKSVFLVDDKLLFIIDGRSGLGHSIAMEEIASLVERYIFMSLADMAVDSSQYMRLMSVGMAEELPFLKGNAPLYRFFVEAAYEKLPEDVLWSLGEEMYERMASTIPTHMFTMEGEGAFSAWVELISSSLEGKGKVRYDNVTKMMIVEWKESDLNLPNSLWLLAFYGYLKKIGREMMVVSRVSEGDSQILQLKIPWSVIEQERF
jgi:sugar-specific transcriptional regulator TrmB